MEQREKSTESLRRLRTLNSSSGKKTTGGKVEIAWGGTGCQFRLVEKKNTKNILNKAGEWVRNGNATMHKGHRSAVTKRRGSVRQNNVVY